MRFLQTPRLVVLAAALVTACSSPSSPPPPPALPLAEQLVQPENEVEALGFVRGLEDARNPAFGLLMHLATEGPVAVRRRALTALGRMPTDESQAEIRAALAAGLDDPDATARANAAFAIGMRGDAALAEEVAEHLHDEDVRVRAALVAAASRLDDPELHEEMLYAFDDPEVAVRAAAVIAAHRWDADHPLAEQVESLLVRVTEKTPMRDGIPIELRAPKNESTGASEDADVIWRALFTLQRRKSERGREAFQRYATATKLPLARLFAVKGLARIGVAADDEPAQELAGLGLQDEAPADETPATDRDLLEAALDDADWRVVVEAQLGLNAFDDARAFAATEPLLQHESSHVRALAFEALGQHIEPADAVRTHLAVGLEDRSASVRAAAVRAIVHLASDTSADRLAEIGRYPDPVLRTAAAQAARDLSPERGTRLLVDLARDEHPRVAGAALESLGTFEADAAREAIRSALSSEDNGVRLAAVMAIGDGVTEADIPALESAFLQSSGDIGPEVRFNILRCIAAVESQRAGALVRRALDDPHPFVRRVAGELLDGQALPVPTDAPEKRELTGDASRSDVASYGGQPMVEVVTNRGVLTFELFPDETPVHVKNFLELARTDHYDGLDFHRIVPDFVAQGGCYRGDGNGAITFDGKPLGQEFTPRKTVRGSLGMPRNDDPDSGGSQIFITHRPTPHLDGRYTIFGELRSGFEVLDALELGDEIVDVRLR